MKSLPTRNYVLKLDRNLNEYEKVESSQLSGSSATSSDEEVIFSSSFARNKYRSLP